MFISHGESHRVERIGWLRAAVLGANDGIISISSLLIGVAAAQTTHSGILITGIAAITAGAMSMAAGEYISVSSQADTEHAEIKREEQELAANWSAESDELTSIYINRGVDPTLSREVANQLMAHNALGAHMHDELGITEALSARPFQAALFSACSFTVGAVLPMIVAVIAPIDYVIPAVFTMSVLFLLLLGALAAKVGGSALIKGAARVAIWGTLAMLITAFIGSVLGTAI